MAKVTRKTIEELREETEQPIALLEGRKYDKALIGFSRDGFETYHAVYDYDKLLEVIQEDIKGTHEDAVEWFEHNTIRSLPHMGDNEPIIVWKEGYEA